MSSLTGAIGNAIGDITGGLLDPLGTSKGTLKQTQEATSQLDIAGLTDEEKIRQRRIDQRIKQGSTLTTDAAASSLSNAQSLGTLFREALIGLSTNQGASPQQIAEATSFIDETFTKPANLALDRATEEFGAQQESRAAALGRQPTDVGFQEELFQNVVRGQQDIQNQRGALIQGRADELAFNRPMQVAGALGQGSRFFNDSASTLFQNQAQLLNLATQQQALGQRERQLGAKQVSTGSGTGFATQTGSPLDTLSQVGNIASGFSGFGGFGG